MSTSQHTTYSSLPRIYFAFFSRSMLFDSKLTYYKELRGRVMVFWTKIGVLSVKKNAFNQKLFSMQLKCKSWIYFYVTIDVSTVLLDKIKKANLVWIKRIRSSNTLIYQSITCRFMTFSLSTRPNVVCLNYSLRAVGTEIQFACHLSLHADLVCCFVCLFCV